MNVIGQALGNPTTFEITLNLILYDLCTDLLNPSRGTLSYPTIFNYAHYDGVAQSSPTIATPD